MQRKKKKTRKGVRSTILRSQEIIFQRKKNCQIFYCFQKFLLTMLVLLFLHLWKAQCQSNKMCQFLSQNTLGNIQSKRYHLKLEVQKNNSNQLVYPKTKKLIQFLNRQKYYSIQYFTKSLKQQQYEIIFQAINIYQYKNRQLITLQKQNSQAIFKSNKSIKYRLPFLKNFQNDSIQNIDEVYYSYTLLLNSNNRDYQYQQFKRLDKLYNIGDYGYQLPLCIVIVGKINIRTFQNSYQSIKNQNYTNYKIIHIDDNSQDQIFHKILQYFQRNLQLKQKVTLIRNNYQRNNLYSRNLGITKFCKDGQIIIDFNINDQLIGRQVFQLINTIYQKGVSYNNKNTQVWLAYMQSIAYFDSCCPFLPNKFQKQFLLKKRSEKIKSNLTINHLRTYLWKLYDKIDKYEMIDQAIPNQVQFYAQRQDVFTHYSMIQMSGPGHLMVIPQNIYFIQNEFLSQYMSLQKIYAQKTAYSIVPYKQLENIKQNPRRQIQYQITNQEKLIIEQKRNQMKDKINNLKNSIEQILQIQLNKKSDIQIISVYRSENQGQILGKQKQFQVDISKIAFQNYEPSIKYQEYGFYSMIQVGTIYDYMNVNKLIDFKILKKKLSDSLAHQVLQFSYNKNIEKQITKLNFTQLNNEEQFQKFLKSSVATFTPQGERIQNDIQYYLGSNLCVQYVQKKTLQLEYYYLNKKYKIQQSKQETSFCIYSSGYNVFQTGRHIKYFDCLQKLNYTNFHIVFVDDYSHDETAYKIYQYLKKTNLRIKNRIKIIRNLQHIGILANIHINILKYCKPDDVVIIVDADDCIIGFQTLNLLNQKYKNPDSWVVYSRFLMNSEHKNLFYKSKTSYPITINLQQYRYTPKYWVTSHLRTFRWKVLDLAPLEHFIQFLYSKKNNIYPHYFQTSADRCQVYSNLQISGKKRVHFLTDYLYLYKTSPPRKCHVSRQMIKLSVKHLDNFDSQPQFINKKLISLSMQEAISQSYKGYLKCQKMANKQN